MKDLKDYKDYELLEEFEDLQYQCRIYEGCTDGSYDMFLCMLDEVKKEIEIRHLNIK